MNTPPIVLPPVGCWALGLEAVATAEHMAMAAQRQGGRAAWLSPEVNFLSNLTLHDNLRLMHDWHAPAGSEFSQRLQTAVSAMGLEWPLWLAQRPSQLSAAQLALARFLRVLVVSPALVVVHPESLRQAAQAHLPVLFELLPAARMVLLDEASEHWPAWSVTRVMGEAEA